MINCYPRDVEHVFVSGERRGLHRTVSERGLNLGRKGDRQFAIVMRRLVLAMELISTAMHKTGGSIC